MTPRGEQRRRRIVCSAVIAVAVGLSTAGCGIGAKQQEADRIHASREKVAEHSPATGTVTFELVADRGALDLEADERAELAAAIGAAGGGNPAVTVQVGIDGGSRRARLSFPTEEGAIERTTVFDDTDVFVRRQNARPTERRTWAKLDLDRIVDNERPIDLRELTAPNVLTAVAATVNPVYLVELVEGALAGSVERVGQGVIGEVAVTRYDANISFDKAITELGFDEEEREVRLRLFRLLGANKDVVPARIWIDDEGRLRRLRVELEQRMTRQRSNTVIATVELVSFGSDASLDVPAAESIVTYERFGRLVRAAMPAEA